MLCMVVCLMMGMIIGAEELFLDKLMGMAVGMVMGMTHLGHGDQFGGGYDLP